MRKTARTPERFNIGDLLTDYTVQNDNVSHFDNVIECIVGLLCR